MNTGNPFATSIAIAAPLGVFLHSWRCWRFSLPPLATPRPMSLNPARSRDYDLQHSRMPCASILTRRKILGEVTHSPFRFFATLTAKIIFDSAGLTIQKVTVKQAGREVLKTTAEKLIISPWRPRPRAGERFGDNDLRYEGKPTKGMYFILPDKDYPDRPRPNLDAGRIGGTRTTTCRPYDYPNDRLTTETILTVPLSWINRFERQTHQRQRFRQGFENLVLERVRSQLYLPNHHCRRRIRRSEKRPGAAVPVTYYAPKGRGGPPPPDQLRTNSSDDGAVQQEIWR